MGNYRVDREPNRLLVPRREEVEISTTGYPVVREVIPAEAEGKSGDVEYPTAVEESLEHDEVTTKVVTVEEKASLVLEEEAGSAGKNELGDD